MKAAEIPHPEKQHFFLTIRLSTNTVADHLNDWTEKKHKCFVAYSIAIDENENVTDVAWLLFILGVNEGFQLVVNF